MKVQKPIDGTEWCLIKKYIPFDSFESVTVKSKVKLFNHLKKRRKFVKTFNTHNASTIQCNKKKAYLY